MMRRAHSLTRGPPPQKTANIRADDPSAIPITTGISGKALSTHSRASKVCPCERNTNQGNVLWRALEVKAICGRYQKLLTFTAPRMIRGPANLLDV
jgi:hypothetical protein